MMKTFFRNLGITVGVLTAASLIAYYAKTIGDAMDPVVVVYIFAIVIVCRFTAGFGWGIVCSAAGVVLTNFFFTYPYFQINFLLEGYPLTFLIMLATALLVSTMTTVYKEQKEEAEKMTERLEKTYEERLVLEKTAEQEKMRANLLRAISHDLRTPLTAIKGSALIMSENGSGMSEEEKKQTLDDIVQESDWLIRMVENLLSITHISAYTMKVNKTDEIAEEVIAAAVSHFNAIVPSGISVSVPEEPILVPMDATLIEQVIINLLDNAVKHTGAHPKISLSLESIDNNAVFTVRDNGSGIDENEIAYIFEYGKAREDSYRTDSSRGFGIGLPTCKTLVESHGGKIWAENNAEGGSSFSFSLPMTDLSKIDLLSESQGENNE